MPRFISVALAAVSLTLAAGCGSSEVAKVAEEAAPELSGARIAELHPPPPTEVGIPRDSVVDAAFLVDSPYGKVEPQTREALDNSASNLSSAEDTAANQIATDPSTDTVNQTLEQQTRVCIKAGLFAVGKTYFEQFNSGQQSFNNLVAAGISACLQKTFPNVPPTLISQAANELVDYVDPSAVQAQESSPTPAVFQNWLVQVGTTS